MRTTALLLTALLGASVTSLGAKPQRDWKIATLQETAFTTQDLGTASNAMVMPGAWGPAPVMGFGTNVRILRTWEGFFLDTDDYTLMVVCRVLRRLPNVTVHGKIKYAMEKGAFYLMDEDGREYRMLVMQKTLKTK